MNILLSKYVQRAAIKNLSAVLEAAGSSLRNVVKINVFLTTMDDFAPMNQVYDEFFGSINPKPVSQLCRLQLEGSGLDL